VTGWGLYIKLFPPFPSREVKRKAKKKGLTAEGLNRKVVVRVESWNRTVVFFNHSPILSRLSPLRWYQSLVKVADIAPSWCGRKVPSIFILSFFLEV
jgi:hypothetical protein